MTRTSEQPDLVARARAADPAAWRQLHEQIGGRLLIWLRTHPLLDASIGHEDIANEAWCTAAARIADFAGDADSFAGWIFGIARKHLLNSNRRAGRRATTPTGEDPRQLLSGSGAFGDDATPLAVQLAWIHALLAQLPSREAEVVACLDVVGLDVAGTASALGISSNGVRVSHHRALRRLRHMLAEPTTIPAPATPITRAVRPTAH